MFYVMIYDTYNGNPYGGNIFYFAVILWFEDPKKKKQIEMQIQIFSIN